MNELLFEWKQFSTLHKDNPPHPDIDVNCFPSTNHFLCTNIIRLDRSRLHSNKSRGCLSLSLSLSVLIFIRDGRWPKLLRRKADDTSTGCLQGGTRIKWTTFSCHFEYTMLCMQIVRNGKRGSHYFGRYTAKDFAFSSLLVQMTTYKSVSLPS